MFLNKYFGLISGVAVSLWMIRNVIWPKFVWPKLAKSLEEEIREDYPLIWKEIQDQLQDGEELSKRPDLLAELTLKVVPRMIQSDEEPEWARELLKKFLTRRMQSQAQADAQVEFNAYLDEIKVLTGSPVLSDSQITAAKKIFSTVKLERTLNNSNHAADDGIQDEEINPKLWQDSRDLLKKGNKWMRLQEVNAIVNQVEARQKVENENLNSRDIYWAIDEAEDAFSQIQEHRPDLLQVYKARVKDYGDNDDVLVRMGEMKNIMAAEVYARRLLELKAEYAVNRLREIPDVRKRYENELDGGEDVFTRVKKMQAIYSAWVEENTKVENTDFDSKGIDSNDEISEWE